MLTSAGAIEVRAPRVSDKRDDLVTGERVRFASAILPPWARKTPKITGVLPLLYLHGLPGGDFVPALGQFPGSSAGRSAAVIIRLTGTWQAEQRAFAARDLPAVGYVYLWADGIHVSIRLAFYGYPAEHGVHLRTTNPIESAFAAVGHRSKITKGPGSRAAGLAMAFKRGCG